MSEIFKIKIDIPVDICRYIPNKKILRGNNRKKMIDECFKKAYDELSFEHKSPEDNS